MAKTHPLGFRIERNLKGHHMYSVPGRSVHTFLQAMLQVWQPMHLSRWKTIEICERTFMMKLSAISD